MNYIYALMFNMFLPFPRKSHTALFTIFFFLTKYLLRYFFLSLRDDFFVEREFWEKGTNGIGSEQCPESWQCRQNVECKWFVDIQRYVWPGVAMDENKPRLFVNCGRFLAIAAASCEIYEQYFSELMVWFGGSK